MEINHEIHFFYTHCGAWNIEFCNWLNTCFVVIIPLFVQIISVRFATR